MATLIRKDRATAADHFQDTRYITFELDEAGGCVDGSSAAERLQRLVRTGGSRETCWSYGQRMRRTMLRLF